MTVLEGLVHDPCAGNIMQLAKYYLNGIEPPLHSWI
jgi:hypothetical protein